MNLKKFGILVTALLLIGFFTRTHVAANNNRAGLSCHIGDFSADCEGFVSQVYLCGGTYTVNYYLYTSEDSSGGCYVAPTTELVHQETINHESGCSWVEISKSWADLGIAPVWRCRKVKAVIQEGSYIHSSKWGSCFDKCCDVSLDVSVTATCADPLTNEAQAHVTVKNTGERGPGTFTVEGFMVDGSAEINPSTYTDTLGPGESKVYIFYLKNIDFEGSDEVTFEARITNESCRSCHNQGKRDRADIAECPPTAVEMIGPWANTHPEGIEITWETGSEVENLGFKVLRNETASLSGASQIGDFIQSQAFGSVVGASYAVIDRNAQEGKTYHYWVVDVEAGGNETANGPVSAVAGGGGLVDPSATPTNTAVPPTNTPVPPTPTFTTVPPTPTKTLDWRREPGEIKNPPPPIPVIIK